MRTLAITGIVTVVMISRITLIDAMRATPPSLRISEGTRSRAITAHAPAFSAIFACSAFVTSMITPPLSISARPTFTRHSFDPLLPLPLPFTFFASILLLLSLLELLDGLSPSNLFLSFHFCPITTNLALLLASTSPAVSRISPVIKMFLLFCLAPLDNNFMLHFDGLEVLDRQFRRHRAHFPEPADFPHRLIEQHRDNSAMRKSPATLVPLTQNKPSHNPPILVVLIKRQLHPAGIVPAAPKTLVHRIRRQRNRLAQSFRSLAHFFFSSFTSFTSSTSSFKPAPPGCAPPAAPRAAVCAFRSSATPPRSPRPAQSAFHPSWQSPAAACLATALARRSTAPAQTGRRALSRESAIRWRRIPAAAPAIGTCRPLAVSSACLRACACAALHPMRPGARRTPCASLRRAC